jgi:MFS family permease
MPNMVVIGALGLLSSLGEWYDFFITAILAATVWPSIFYPNLGSSVALSLGAASFGITFLSRPLGALVLGHYSDRVGRRQVILWSSLVTGVCSLAIAFVPSYALIGLVGIYFIVFLRFLIGLGLGGNYGGAASWVSEFAQRSSRRGLWGAFIQASVSLGTALPAFALWALSIYLTNAEVVAWGWRLAVGVGVLMFVPGAIVRYRYSESPMFSQLKETKAVERSPVIVMLREKWVLVLALGLVTFPSFVWTSGLQNPYAISYLVASHVPMSSLLLALFVSQAFGTVMRFGFGHLADKIGRKLVAVIGAVWMAIAAFPYFWIANTLNITYIMLDFALVGLGNAISNTVIASILTEQFPTKYRASGVGFTLQIAGLYAGLLVTFLVPVILDYSGGVLKAWPGIAWMMVVSSILSVIPLFFLKETKNIDLT